VVSAAPTLHTTTKMHQEAVMWSETVGLRTRPVWDQKIGLGLAHCTLVLFCETRSCNAHRHDLEGRSNLLPPIYFLCSVLGTSLLWRSTVAFTYLKVKSAKCLCLLPVIFVLVLSFWSWSEEFGLVYITVKKVSYRKQISRQRLWNKTKYALHHEWGWSTLYK